MKRLAWPLLTIVLGGALSGYAQAQASAPTGSTPLKNPVQLCERLAGTEREICLRDARENPGGTGAAVGATPGTGGEGARARAVPGAKPDENKRGNTPPGTTRGGDAPAAGAIVDPAGVTKR
jgi:hypothetical protein